MDLYQGIEGSVALTIMRCGDRLSWDGCARTFTLGKSYMIVK